MAGSAALSLILSGSILPGRAEAQATEGARAYLRRAIEACNSIRTGRASFDQARTALGLAAPDQNGFSKREVGTTPDQLLTQILILRPGANGAKLCTGMVAGARLPGRALAEQALAAAKGHGPGEVVAPERTVGDRGHQTGYAFNDGVLLMTRFDDASPGSSTTTATIILAW